jgi:hypothetical protein
MTSKKWKEVVASTFYGDLEGNATSATGISTSGGTAAKFWRGDNSWSDTISGGTLKITANSNTVTIGSINSSWCHFSSGVKYHFNPDIWAVGGFHVTNTDGSDLGANYTSSECTVIIPMVKLVYIHLQIVVYMSTQMVNGLYIYSIVMIQYIRVIKFIMLYGMTLLNLERVK